MKNLIRSSVAKVETPAKHSPKNLIAASVLACLPLISSCNSCPSGQSPAMVSRNQDAEIAMCAIKLSDNDAIMLGSVAINSTHPEVRMAALKAIDELHLGFEDGVSPSLQDKLKIFDNIARNSGYLDSAMGALEAQGQMKYFDAMTLRTRFDDPMPRLPMQFDGEAEMLAFLGKESASADVRMAAVGKLAHLRDSYEWRPRAMLVSIATESKHADARNAAVSALAGDEESLLSVMCAQDECYKAIHLVKNKPEGGIRADAIGRLEQMLDTLKSEKSFMYLSLYSEKEAVRAAAMKKLENMLDTIANPQALVVLVNGSGNPDIRLAALRKIQSFSMLDYFARFSEDHAVQLAAVQELRGNASTLKDIALDIRCDFEVRSSAVQALANNLRELKARRAQEPQNSSERDSEIRSLEYSKQPLMDVAFRLNNSWDTGDKELALAAIDGLAAVIGEVDSVRLLSSIAAYSSDAQARLQAVCRIPEDYELGRIAKEGEYADARLAAVEKLGAAFRHEEPDLAHYFKSISLRSVAAESEYQDARSAALERLSRSPDDLADIAVSTVYGDTAMAALRKIKGRPDLLVYVADNTQGALRSNAIAGLSAMVQGISDPNGLRMVAAFSGDAAARSAALDKLSGNERSLKYVVKYSTHEDARNRAHELLGN